MTSTRYRAHMPVTLLFLTLVLGPVIHGWNIPPRSEPVTDAERLVVRDVASIGVAALPPGTQFQETEVGGLSGITYDAARDRYYVISDDRGSHGSARFYTVKIDLAGDLLRPNGLSLVDMTPLADENGLPFPSGAIDAEGIAYAGDDVLFIASEGSAGNVPPIDPFISAFGLDGRRIKALPLPEKFLPDGQSQGVRENLAFESLTLRPDDRFLFTATENALVQDGPPADTGQSSLVRILAFDKATNQPGAEFVYEVEPVARVPNPPEAGRVSGLVELLALDNDGSFLALERSYSQGIGFVIRLFLVRTQGTLDVQSLDSLPASAGDELLAIDPPVTKKLLLNLNDLGGLVDNVEGMTFGPDLADGRRSLILVSDNNFNGLLSSRFIALALTIDSIPAVPPVTETPPLTDSPLSTLPTGAAAGPSIWLHPANPSQSLVIGAATEGGLMVYDLDGNVVQSATREPYGSWRLQDVDLLYRFPLNDDKVDLAVAYDGQNDTLAILRINPADGRLAGIQSAVENGVVFGSANEDFAVCIVAIQSPVTGRPFVFAGRQDDNRLIQLELTADGAGGVTAVVAREFGLPAGFRTGGCAADRQLGYIYVTSADNPTLLKFDAEPEKGNSFEVIEMGENSISGGFAAPALAYGAGQSGYLLVSAAEEQSFGLFLRAAGNQYLGQFIITGQGGVDAVNRSTGLDLLLTPLGPALRHGLLVAQDSFNEPQELILNDLGVRNGSSNFKYLSWEQVALSMPEALSLDNGTFNPRFPARVVLPVVIGQ